MPAGTAIAVDRVADSVASHRLFQKDCRKSGWSNTASNQRRETPAVGRLSVFSGVKATRQTITSGASMKITTSVWKTKARGPLRDIGASAEGLPVPSFDDPVVAEHDGQVGGQQDHRDGGAQRPVQRAQ